MNTNWHSKPINEILNLFSVTSETGISEGNIEKLREKYGYNELPKGKQIKWWQLMLRQFNNPMVITLLVAAGLTLWLATSSSSSHGDENFFIDFYVIILAVLVNVGIGFWQEFRSSKIFERLKELIEVRARVKRGGKVYEIDSEELVPGDIIILRLNTKIAADCRIISSANLEANEALLTGESSPVKKNVKELDEETALGDRSDMVFMGTFISKGGGEAVVVSTGRHTELGKIASLTASVEEESTPLQERLSHFGKILAIYILLLSAIIFGVGFWETVNEGKSYLEAFTGIFTITVAVIVAAIPEGLPAAMSVVLAVSAQRLLKRKGLVKKLVGAETLGSASVIVTDKTGTLTTGKMEVLELIETNNKEKAALILALANEAFMEEGGEKEIRGEETDKAKMRYYLKNGGSVEELSKYKRCAILPFNQTEKYIASFHESKEEAYVFLTGAPENLLELTTMDEKRKKEITQNIENYASRGFRMIGIAERKVGPKSSFNCDDEEKLGENIKDIEFIGVAALRDPIREDVREAVKITREAGVKIIMATGDHRLTARAIGVELGFSDTGRSIISGREIDEMSDEELSKRINSAEIFSRVSPEHKMRIINALKNKGEVVAMTGDGVNDAPALKSADIGIALGSGTDVTKETADLILMDNSFSIITEAIKQGRIAFDNIRKVTLFLLANSFTEIIIVLATLVLKVPLPVTAVMILWANLVEDGFPNFALAFEPAEKNIMKRNPYSRNESIMDKPSLVITFFIGIFADLMLLGVYLFLYYNYLDVLGLSYIRTITFSMLATNSLIYVFSIKSLSSSILKTNMFDNKFLLFAVFFGLTVMAASIYVPLLQDLLGTVSLNLLAVLSVLGLGILQLILIELVKWWYNIRRTGNLAV